ncbi:MAG TPA: hypothetical protein VLS93_03865, partial [Anaeromyxobacteraceae bacterium]|nr:hypothetical protein [Anaeromyxobacteraceae bacterium]
EAEKQAKELAKAEEKARREAEEQAEELAKAEEKARREAEKQAKAQAKADEKARREAEKAQVSADDRSRREADAQARAEAEAIARAQAEAEEAARAQARAEARAPEERRAEERRAEERRAEERRAEERQAEERQAEERQAERGRPEVAYAEPLPGRSERLEAGAPSAQLREVGFQNMPGVSRVFVRTSVTPRFVVQDLGEDTVRIEFENTRVMRWNDTNHLDTSFFASAVAMITPSRRGTNLVVDIKLRQRVPYQQRIEGDMLAIDFERPAGAEAPAPGVEPAAPGEPSDEAAGEPAAEEPR